MSQSDLVEIVHELRLQLFKRGQSSLRTLGVAFRLNDKDHTGLFDFEEIEKIFAKVGLFLKRQSLTLLYKYFDRQQNEQIYYPEILNILKGELSTRRYNMIVHIFQLLDKKSRGGVDIDLILNTYNATLHPQVLSGEKKINEVTKDFNLAMEGCGQNNNGLVLKDEFVEYYWNICKY
jgi:Ca2+-binding EF-hand superfamily protein